MNETPVQSEIYLVVRMLSVARLNCVCYVKNNQFNSLLKVLKSKKTIIYLSFPLKMEAIVVHWSRFIFQIK